MNDITYSQLQDLHNGLVALINHITSNLKPATIGRYANHFIYFVINTVVE